MTKITNPANQTTILLVEDKQDDVLLTKIAMQEAKINANLLTVKTGIQAIELIKEFMHKGKQLPNLILLDINLPIMNGLEILDNLKIMGILSSIPVVIFTSSDSLSDINHCYQNGIELYLKKPNNINDYKNTMYTIKEHFKFN